VSTDYLKLILDYKKKRENYLQFKFQNLIIIFFFTF
jgi:hypothetical protein